MAKEELLKIIEDEEVEFVSFQFTTLGGELKHMVIPSRDLAAALEDGVGFDGSCAKFTRVNKSDLLLRPDPKTLRILPWEEIRTASMFCDLYLPDLATPLAIDPRGILRRIIREMQEEFGEKWQVTMAPELEYYLLSRDEDGNIQPSDNGDYFAVPPRDRGEDIRKKCSLILDKLGLQCEKNHHEGVVGKHEINFVYSDALTAADKTMLFKRTVRRVADDAGYIASFMPKPFYGRFGTGMHVHMGLYDGEAQQNLFHDPDAEHGISATGRAFMAGLMAHAPALAGITNPSVNSYKRLVPGWEAPVYIAWGFYNRSALLRVPISSPKALRVEDRNPDASCNPYLAFAALIAAGLDGIRKGLTVGPPIEENIYDMSPNERAEKGIGQLPGSLGEALERLKEDEILAKALGEDLITAHVATKEKEWVDYCTRVHAWEIEQYIDV